MNKKSKILTILGTRPEIIRLSRIIPKLDQLSDQFVLYSGQNYDPNLSSVFFSELELRSPDCVIDSKSNSFAEQLGKILVGVEQVIKEFCPDRVLLLGDTNTDLSAIVCERMGVPVYHMEAGNRCYDFKVPEEVNRRIIDSISRYNLPYTEYSRQNLLREGLPNQRIMVTGNPIFEVLNYYKDKIDNSQILSKLNLSPQKYVLVTAHRAENVDDPQRLTNIVTALKHVAKSFTVVFSCHPRTQNMLDKYEIDYHDPNIVYCQPMGFLDFVKLEKNCIMAISDSGTVQEEMSIFQIPTVTIRDSTERPETVFCGSNIVTGLDTDSIINGYHAALTMNRNWKIPEGYCVPNVSDIVANILLSK